MPFFRHCYGWKMKCSRLNTKYLHFVHHGVKCGACFCMLFVSSRGSEIVKYLLHINDPFQWNLEMWQYWFFMHICMLSLIYFVVQKICYSYNESWIGKSWDSAILTIYHIFLIICLALILMKMKFIFSLNIYTQRLFTFSNLVDSKQKYFYSLIFLLKSKINSIYNDDKAHIKQWPCFCLKCFPKNIWVKNEKRYVVRKIMLNMAFHLMLKAFFIIEQKMLIFELAL